MAAQTDAQLAASPAAQFAAQLAAQLARSGFPAGCSVKRLSYQLGKLQAACVFLAWLSFSPKKQQEARHKASSIARWVQDKYMKFARNTEPKFIFEYEDMRSLSESVLDLA